MASAQLEQSQPMDLAGSKDANGNDIVQEAIVSSIGDMPDGPEVTADEILQILNESEEANLAPPPNKLAKPHLEIGVDNKLKYALKDAEPSKLDTESIFIADSSNPSHPKSDNEEVILYVERYSGTAYAINSDSGMACGSHGML